MDTHTFIPTPSPLPFHSSLPHPPTHTSVAILAEAFWLVFDSRNAKVAVTAFRAVGAPLGQLVFAVTTIPAYFAGPVKIWPTDPLGLRNVQLPIGNVWRLMKEAFLRELLEALACSSLIG